MTEQLASIPGIAERHSRQILDLFKTLPSGTQVILFGSRAKGNFREGSDIDVALQGESVGPADRDRLLQGYFDLELPWKLDIVIYRQIEEPALKAHIDRAGRAIGI